MSDKFALTVVERTARKKREAELLFHQAVGDAADAGCSYREIAERAGISKARVGQLVKTELVPIEKS